MISFPNAKINLGLNILSKRTDGYHDIETVMYPVPLREALEVLESKEFFFQNAGISIPSTPQDNLCVKTYRLLQKDFNLPTVGFFLYKNIPIGAGLGGGSADVAFLLKMLNSLYNLELSSEGLEDYARQLGSDCAFFIDNRPKFCFEKGDKFEDIRLSLAGKYIVLVYPNIHISTQEAYQHIKPKTPETTIKEIIRKDIKLWKNYLKNDFEEGVFLKYPLLSEIRSTLYQNKALYASMTGSGSCIYGIFSEEVNLKKIFKNSKVFEGYLE